MTQFKRGDQVVVTGPLVLTGLSVEASYIGLELGQTGTVESAEDEDDILIDDGEFNQFYIAASSLTLHEEFLEAPDFDWSQVHDYVHEGDDD